MQLNSQKTLSILDQVFFGARNFVMSALVVRWFGAEIFGYYILLMTLTTLIVRIHSGLVNLPLSLHNNLSDSDLSHYMARHILVYILIIVIALFAYLVDFPSAFSDYGAISFMLGSMSIINNEFHRRFCLINKLYYNALFLNICMCISAALALYWFYSIHADSAAIIYFSFVVGGLPSWIFIICKLRILNVKTGKIPKFGRVDIDISTAFFLQWLTAQCIYYLTFLYIGVAAVALLGIYRTLFAPFIILVSALDGYLPSRLSSCAESKNKFHRAMTHELLSIAAVIIFAGIIIFSFYAEIIANLFNPKFIDEYTLAYLSIYFMGMLIGTCNRVLVIALRSLNVNAKLTFALFSALLFILATMFIMRDLQPNLAAPSAIVIGEIILLIAVAWRLLIATNARKWS